MMSDEDKKIASDLMKESYDKGFKDGLEMAIASLHIIYNGIDKKKNTVESTSADNSEGTENGGNTGDRDAK